MEKIDFVITWVDGNDPDWIAKKNEFSYSNSTNLKNDTRNIRYRDMDCLKYWFRGVEKYANWVNKIYFVVDNQVPEWLNTDNKKIVIVNHSDFIPKEYLPTFNSSVIELYFNKINGLSDKFVYFNDDMYIINKTAPETFFKENLPCDIMALSPLIVLPDDNYHRKLLNNIEIINKNFNFNECMKKNKKKYFSLKLGKFWIYNVLLSKYNSFIGFKDFHFPTSYLKSTFDEVWNKESDFLKNTSQYKFRNNESTINHWLFQYWHLAQGKFYPRNDCKFGKCTHIDDLKIDKLLNRSSYKVCCINDKNVDGNYEEMKIRIVSAFEKKFPKKSSFEK